MSPVEGQTTTADVLSQDPDGNARAVEGQRIDPDVEGQEADGLGTPRLVEQQGTASGPQGQPGPGTPPPSVRYAENTQVSRPLTVRPNGFPASAIRRGGSSRLG